MKKILQALVLGSILLSPIRANILPPGKDTGDIMVGVTGLFVAVKSGRLVVTDVTAGTPSAGQLEKGDVLLGVDGKSLEVQDPRHPLGFAINEAEGRDGRMEFSIKRGDTPRKVAIQLEPIGSYSATYPIDCAKSKRIIDETAAFILANGGPGDGITGNLEGLFLLSTGDGKYLPALAEYAAGLVAKGPVTSTWHIGYSGIFLGEYYLATGDKRVLPALEARCKALSAGQFFDGWGHKTTNCNPGYVTGGVLNAAGAQGLTTLILSRECGIQVDDDTYNSALRFFFRFAGRGNVPYGNHHPEMEGASNGKNGGLASALTLLPDRKFQAGAQLLALSETDSYWACEGGHGSCFGNQTWRNIVDALVPKEHHKSWRRHKDEMIWFYELSRMPGGGFRTPWYPGHKTIGQEPLFQTGLIAMAYTAHLKNLRICRKPRTKFSVPHKATSVEMALETDDFHRTDLIEGAVIEEQPHEIAEVFQTIYNPDGSIKSTSAKASENDKGKRKMPAAWYARLMRHYSPTVREWAAHGLGNLGEEAIPEIKKALASKDGRLRAAGLDAISCATGWSLGRTGSNITPEMINEHFLPQIVAPLHNPDSPIWEKRQALMALSCAGPASIKANLAAVKPRFGEDEWWLRAAAFHVMLALVDDTEAIRTMLPAMLASYDADTYLPSRRWGATNFFKTAIAANPEVKDEIIAGMAKSLREMELREGIERAIDVNNTFETLRYIDMKRHPENAEPFLPSIERIYPDLEPLPATWTVTGARWGNIGLAKAGELLGEEGRPFVASMKRIRPALEAMAKSPGKQAKNTQQALARLDEVVKAWEDKFGGVKGN
jgi:hypothetical protein